MRYKKIYGASQKTSCPFCGDTATTTNFQKIPVCLAHKHEELNDLKCACGDWLDIKFGKFGPFFVCMNCGPISFSKGLDLNGYPLKVLE